MTPITMLKNISIRYIVFVALLVFLVRCDSKDLGLDLTSNDLLFNMLPQSWDEGLPLGNGPIGALIWQKEGKLRFSLDRTDLWDLRPVENLALPAFNYHWVREQWENDTYKNVQDLFDGPYDRMPAPSKIPGAALEFDIEKLGKVNESRVSITDGTAHVSWEKGAVLQTLVQADAPFGWFKFTGIPEGFVPILIPPAYQAEKQSGEVNPVTGQELDRLGYEQGTLEINPNKIIYRQQGYGDFQYEVAVAWKTIRDEMVGVWSITSSLSETSGAEKAEFLVSKTLESTTFENALKVNKEWWSEYWSKSSIVIPDSILQKQYYLEMYKFGSIARKDAPPISLQAVWTADNGKLPPWKGDYHHDLNTQLSYWPAYTGNQLEAQLGFLNWLWDHRATFKAYTSTYYGTSGLNVPGVTTLTGEPMGGWIQYSFGPTVGAWLGHHFYLHWQYSQDREFLVERAYPWIKDVATYLDEVSERDTNGWRKLPLSSSPEINNNARTAWFDKTTNFDLALIRWNFEKAGELATLLGLGEEAEKWNRILKEWPELALNPSGNGLSIAPDFPYASSHRHFSHLIGWHPLGILDWSQGENERNIIRGTLKDLEDRGSDEWVGYSFSWLGNLYARAGDGIKAAEILRVFAENFVLPNSFHVNGEQHNRGFTNFKYRPFTLEGNFAFASGIQEMLIQSHTGVVVVFPAIPDTWLDVSFQRLRTVGAFLVSARREGGHVTEVLLYSEKGGTLQLKNPFGGSEFDSDGHPVVIDGEILQIAFGSNEEIRLSRR
jgi:alpha-L-fucosidase 2